MKLKRILSLLTVMAMLLSCVGITAMAEDAVTVSSMEELAKALETANSTITASAVLTVAEGETYDLDLNDCTVNMGAYYIENNGTLTIKNGTLVSAVSNDVTNGAPLYNHGGTLTVDGGTYTGVIVALRVEGGTATINDGTFNVTYTVGESTNHLIRMKGDSLTINGGTFNGNSKENSNGGCMIMSATGGTTDINGGTFTGFAGASMFGDGTGVTVKGGTFTPDDTDGFNFQECMTSYLAEGYEVGDDGVVSKTAVTPAGDITRGYITDNYYNTGNSGIFGQAEGVIGTESFVVKLYSGEALVGTAALVDHDKALLNGKSQLVAWHILATQEDDDSWWDTDWVTKLNVNTIPDKVELWVDGMLVDTGAVELNNTDLSYPICAAVTDEDGNVQSFVAGTGYFNGTGVNVPVYDEAFQTALNAGGNIVLLRDVTLTKVLTVPAGKTVNLDLNGKTITNNVVNNRIFHVYADFTIDGTDEGSSIVSGAAGTHGVLSIEADCAVTLNGGSYTGSTTGASGAKGGIIKAIKTSANGAELTLNNVNVETNNWIIDSPAYLDSLTITGGTYATNGVGITAVINQNGTATLTDVAVTSGSGPAVELSGYSTSTATLSGCTLNAGPDTVNAYGTGGTALCVVSNIAVNVESGSYTGTTYAAGITTSGKTLNINGGEFNGAIASHNDDGTVTIEGGNFTNFAVNTNGSTGKVAISGGTFNADVSDYCVDGFVATKNVDGTYGIIVKPELPTATVTEISEDELTAGNAPELTFSKRFTAVEPTELQNSYYGDWFADFVLTVNKDVTFNADGSADGYLAGQYDAWSESWISVPFENVTMKAGESLKIMEYAAQHMGKPDLKVTYYDVANFVKVFDCGVFFDEEFLAANPDLKVTLELRMYNPEDETESYAIGETYEFTAEDIKKELFPFYAMNLDLESSMVANFYVESTNFDGADYYAKVVHSSATGDNEEIIDFAQWEDNNGYKVISYSNLAAKNMADKITIAIYDGNNNQVSEERETSLGLYALSYIKAYDESTAKTDLAAKWTTAFVDMLNYGAEAQKYFGYNSENLANAGIDKYQDYATKAYVALEKDASVSGAVYSANLDLVDRIVYNGYFKDVTEDMYAVVKFTNHTGSDVEYRVNYEDFIINGGYYQIKIDKLVIADANCPITITVYDAEENVYAQLTESINGYLCRASATNPEFSALAQAMAKFTASAYTALHSNN